MKLMYALAVSLIFATPSLAEGCFLDDMPLKSQQAPDKKEVPEFGSSASALPAPNIPADYLSAYRGATYSMLLALSLIEHRNSCGLMGETDERYYEAIQNHLNCDSSPVFEILFGSYLSPDHLPAYAAPQEAFSTEQDFSTYCEMVAEIDVDYLYQNLDDFVQRDPILGFNTIKINEPLLRSIGQYATEHR